MDQDIIRVTTGNNEHGFDYPSFGDANIAQRHNAIDPKSVNVYELMNECYYGNGRVRSGEYLIPFSRESDYNARRKLAHYKNYLKPIVRSMVEPCFNKEADRTVEGNKKKFQKFIDNCDAAGTTLQQFSHSTLNICRRHGVVFTVVDNFNESQQPATQMEAERMRIMPYVYNKQAYETQFDWIETDDFGNLVSIIFREKDVKINGETERRYRKWTANESILLKENKTNSDEKFIPLSVNVHGLGEVPVIISYSDIPESKHKVLVEPPLYDIAIQNLTIYNQGAEIRDQERAQAFSILFAQGLSKGDLTIGPRNLIIIGDKATIPPGYASPDFNIIAGLVHNQEQNRKDLFLIAEQQGVVGIESSESGIAKAFDFFAHEDTLRRTSYVAMDLEYRISEFFKYYTEDNFEYQIIYPTDFAPMGLDREIDRLDKILRMPGLNKTFKYRLQEKLARLVFVEEDKSITQEIIDSIHEEETKPVPEPPVVNPEPDNIDDEQVTEEV
jgi:hypothetical protein